MTAATVSSKDQSTPSEDVRGSLGIMSESRLQAISLSEGTRHTKEPEVKGLLKGLPVVDSAIRVKRDRALADDIAGQLGLD